MKCSLLNMLPIVVEFYLQKCVLLHMGASSYLHMSCGLGRSRMKIGIVVVLDLTSFKAVSFKGTLVWAYEGLGLFFPTLHIVALFSLLWWGSFHLYYR